MASELLALASHALASTGFLAAMLLVLHAHRARGRSAPLLGFATWWGALAVVEASRALQHALADLGLPVLHRALVLARLVALVVGVAALAGYVIGVYTERIRAWRIVAATYSGLASALVLLVIPAPLQGPSPDAAHDLVGGSSRLVTLAFMLVVVAPSLAICLGYARVAWLRLDLDQRRRHATLTAALLSWVGAFAAAYVGWNEAAHALALASAGAAWIGCATFTRRARDARPISA